MEAVLTLFNSKRTVVTAVCITASETLFFCSFFFRKCLVDTKKILLLPLHIKLGQFVKALLKEGEYLNYLCLSVLVYPMLIWKKESLLSLTWENLWKMKMLWQKWKCKKIAWISFIKLVVTGFIKNKKAQTTKRWLLSCFKTTKCWAAIWVSKCISFFHIWTTFLKVLGLWVRNKNDRLHQDIKQMERRYQGQCNVNMMDYKPTTAGCWQVKSHKNIAEKVQNKA